MSSVETVGSDTAVSAPTAAPQGQAAPAPAVAPETSQGQAAPQAQGATTEENFSSIDPKTLPPELQAVHKSLLGDYTKKTMAIADKEKAMAEATRKAAEYDKLTQDQRFKDTWAEMSRKEKTDFKEQKAEAEKRLGEKISDEDFAKAFNSKDDFLSLLERVVEDKRAKDQQKIQELEQKVTQKDAADVIDSVALEVGKDGQPLRPDFYELNDLISGVLRLNPPANPGEFKNSVTAAYDWAKSYTQKFYEKGRAEALKVIEHKVQNSSLPPTITSKNAYAGPDPKKLDASEAVALARKGIRVPQN